jgi:hypothetical protein
MGMQAAMIAADGREVPLLIIGSEWLNGDNCIANRIISQSGDNVENFETVYQPGKPVA